MGSFTHCRYKFFNLLDCTITYFKSKSQRKSELKCEAIWIVFFTTNGYFSFLGYWNSKKGPLLLFSTKRSMNAFLSYYKDPEMVVYCKAPTSPKLFYSELLILKRFLKILPPFLTRLIICIYIIYIVKSDKCPHT